MDDQDCDAAGMDRYRRRNADLDELLRIAAEQLRAAESKPKEPVLADELRLLPVHPRFSRYVGRLSGRDQDEWIDRMKNRWGGEW
jgi:hypothetical protein